MWRGWQRERSFLEQTNRCSLPVLPCNEFNVSPGPAVAPAVVAVAVGRRPTLTLDHPLTLCLPTPLPFCSHPKRLSLAPVSARVPSTFRARFHDLLFPHVPPTSWKKINASVFVLPPWNNSTPECSIRRGLGNFWLGVSRETGSWFRGFSDSPRRRMFVLAPKLRRDYSFQVSNESRPGLRDTLFAVSPSKRTRIFPST